MQTTALLGAADLELIIKILIFLVIAGFSVAMNLHKWMSKKQAGDRPVNPPPGRPRPNADLSSEVDAFLQSVQQRQQDQPARGPRRRTSAGRRPPRRREPMMAEVVEAEVVPVPVRTLVRRSEPFGRGPGGQRESVADEADRIVRQSQALGSHIDQTDERVAEQIHATFDHQLGQFDAATSASDDSTLASSAADNAAADLTAALRLALSNPSDVRRAIVLSEILSPPTERW